ncbi:MAG: rod shape-determining protein MreC [Melioribacteraceae bacterium]|nr:rod shape-determining protein MreC [Melioribacteraceae bacterium]
MIDFVKRIIYSIREYLILIILLLVSLSLISQNETPSLQKIKSFAFVNIAVINNIFHNIFMSNNDSNEIIMLKRRNAELMLTVNKLREYAIENSEIKGMLKFTNESESDLLSANIIAKNFGNIIGNIIINRGEKDSIKVGMPVINHLGLIGIVYQTSNDFSLIRTLRNSKLKIAVEAQRSGVQGILSWEVEKLTLKNIPATYDINIGDRIITSDFSTLFPPKIPIGVVVKKENNISGLVSDIVIQPYVDFNKINNLFVKKLVISKELNEFELNMLKNIKPNE